MHFTDHLRIKFDAKYIIVTGFAGLVPFLWLSLLDPNSGFPTTQILILYSSMIGMYVMASALRSQSVTASGSGPMGNIITVLLLLAYIALKANNFLNHQQSDIRSTFNYDAYHYWYGMALPIPLIYKYNEFIASKSGTAFVRIFVVTLVICFSLLTGTRAFAIFFIMSYFAVPRRLDYSIAFLVLISFVFIAIASLLRGISVDVLSSHIKHVLFGGQYLYTNNVQRIHESIAPGWQALMTITFPGFFVLLATLCDAYLGTGMSYYHYESVFWWTHQFQYVPQLGVPMNSYFTPLLHAEAVGYWKYVSVLSITAFLVGSNQSDKLRCLGISILGYYFVCGFMYSIFNNSVFCFLLAIVVLSTVLQLCLSGLTAGIRSLRSIGSAS